jgi:ABC-type multidrug transport system fused ATPase/permease subunit
VSQDPILFSGTLRENICYGVDDPDEEWFLGCCQRARVLEFVNNTNQFPEGFDTLVGEKGLQLSGGQK